MRPGYLRRRTRHHRLPRYGPVHPVAATCSSFEHHCACAETGRQFRGQNLQGLRNLLPILAVQALLPRNTHHQVALSLSRPNSSRESSAEHFLVGLNFHKDQKVDQVELSTFFREVKSSPMEGQSEKIFKFVTCGDLSGFDPIGELPEEQ